ncbi:MAG TPA: hypothetical protein VGF76_25545, partial [Polyangiaceae bacterium]
RSAAGSGVDVGLSSKPGSDDMRALWDTTEPRTGHDTHRQRCVTSRSALAPAVPLASWLHAGQSRWQQKLATLGSG